jgi:hypothetical protein
VGTPGLATKKLCNQASGREPFGQCVAVAAMRAEDDVIAQEVCAHAGRYRLFADIRMTCPVDQASRMGAGQVLFAPPDCLHLAVQIQERALFTR